MVSSDWLHDVLMCQRVLPPSKFLHKPVSRFGVSELKDAVISISGFVGQERSDMKVNCLFLNLLLLLLLMSDLGINCCLSSYIHSYPLTSKHPHHMQVCSREEV